MIENRKTGTPAGRPGAAPVSVYLLRFRGARIARTGRYSRKQQSAQARTLLQAGLVHHTGNTAADWRVDRSAAGRPIVETDANLRASIAHSGEYIVAGVGHIGSIGLDIERLRDRGFDAIARQLDWPAAVRNPNGAIDADGFYHAWTLWEAAIKARPDDSPLAARAVFEPIVSELTVGRPGVSSHGEWFARSWRCRDRFWLSVICADSQPADVRVFRVNGLNSDGQTSNIEEMSADDGVLDPHMFEHDHVNRNR